jgi:hypothetical protein
VAEWGPSGGDAEVAGPVSSVSMQGEGVDHEGVAEEVEVLAAVPDAVRSAEPEGAVEGAVDRFGVVAQREQGGEVWVAGWDRSEVFVRLSLRAASAGVPWSRTVMVVFP